MTASLRHRGPDGEGYYSDAAVELGHRRLSIIDLATGDQPMHSEDGRYHIVYNGEIYNYIELRQDLEARGVRFRTHSDTEVLLHHVIRGGPESLSSLNGMFAFAIWDRHEESLFLARDRIGIKPLHYAVCEERLVFASELRALEPFPGLPRAIDPLSVSKYFSYGYIPAPHTIFQNIHKLEPGHYLKFRAGTVRTAPYWRLPLGDEARPDTGSLAECRERVTSLLSDAVRLQLRSDVPVGVFLSGGLDSSLLTALVSAQAPRSLQTFSIGFDEGSYDESPYARQVAARFQTDHHHEVLTASKAASLIPGILEGLDEPHGDASMIPTRLLSSVTAQRVKVALGGDGGDELFAGYPSFAAHRLMESLVRRPRLCRLLSRAATGLPASSHYASAGYLLEQFFKGADLPAEIRFLIWMGIYGDSDKRQLLNAGVRESLREQDPFEDARRHVVESGLSGGLNRLLYLCAKMYLQDGVLNKVDRASMAHSLEVRVPYLDHRLVEYVSGLPVSWKCRSFTTKVLLKQAAEPYLPKRIVRRRKAGFMMPLASWLRGELRDLVEAHCSEARLKETGLFNAAFVRSMLEDHFTKRRDYRKMIWTLLAFQCWLAGPQRPACQRPLDEPC